MPTDPAPLQDALVRTAETHGPGLVGLVTEHGEPVFEGAVGVTDLADGRPPTADDWFRIGSVTKTYVSAVLVQLLREGAFARSDTVEQWLPGLVPGGEQLPVELLLRMRSGLPDYACAMLGTPPDMSRVTGYQRPEQLVAVAMAQPDRNPPRVSRSATATPTTCCSGSSPRRRPGPGWTRWSGSGSSTRSGCATRRSPSRMGGCAGRMRPGTSGWPRTSRTRKCRCCPRRSRGRRER